MTYFAEAERTPPETFERQRRIVTSNPLVVALLDSFPEPAAIMNGHRQIVLANDKFGQLTGTTPEKLVGRRVGEAIGCEYSSEPPAGCGTTPACALCGALKAVAATQATGEAAHEECRLTLSPERGHESLEMGVWTTPVDVGHERFTVFALKDTSAEQRRRVLERMFFHDLLNSAGGLQNLLQILPQMPTEQLGQLTQSASNLAGQVVEEIQAQRDLAAAERGELEPRLCDVNVPALLEGLVTLYQHHSTALGKTISLEVEPLAAAAWTDATLLRRVLGNLVKNALEASRPGETVTVRYRQDGGPLFEVHNCSVMEEAVKLQVFRRSFTTKQGMGRGVGSYSARLLTERYLRGELRFRSEDGEGTTFTVRLPEI